MTPPRSETGTGTQYLAPTERGTRRLHVTPANAGVQSGTWIPAFAGMTAGWPRAGLWLAVLGVALLCGQGKGQELTPQDAAALASAQAAFDAGQHEQAVGILTPLRERYPNHGDVPRLLAHAYYELGRYAEARRTALEALGAGRWTADVLVRLAQIDERRQDPLALINTVRLLTIIDAENGGWRMLYGDLLAASEAQGESVAVYRSALEKQPDHAPLHLRLGNVLLKQQRFAEAVSALETAWHLGASDPVLARTIAGCWEQLGDQRQAITWIERALALGGPPPASDAELQLRLAGLLFEVGELDSAAEQVGPLATSAEAKIRGPAHVLLGRIALKREQVERAMDHWRQAVEAGADAPQLLAALGAHWFNAGDFPRAGQYLRQLVDAEDGANEAHLRFLVVSLVRSNDRSKAREYLRQYLERHGLGGEARQLIRLWKTSSP